MISYHVFFTPKPEVSDAEALAAVHGFLGGLEKEKHLRHYRVMRVTNPASFHGLPRFQAIVDYATQEELDAAMAFMRQPGKKEAGPHGQLMHILADFRVSFTADA